MSQPITTPEMETIAQRVVEAMKPAWWQKPLGAFALSLSSGFLGGVLVLVLDKLWK